MRRFSARALFETLDGSCFEDHRRMQSAVLELFNEHLADFPPGYSYEELLEWGIQNSWVIPEGGGAIRIQVKTKAPESHVAAAV